MYVRIYVYTYVPLSVLEIIISIQTLLTIFAFVQHKKLGSDIWLSTTSVTAI